MYFVYLLKSKKDEGYYIGFTLDPVGRAIEHRDGLVVSTRNRRPVEMIYLEGYATEKQARERESKLKKFGSVMQPY